MNKIGIIILSYNRSDVVNECIKSIALAKNKTPLEVYLLDNDSKPEEYKKIKKTFDFYLENNHINGRIIRAEKNHGYPKGNNFGISFFLKREDITHICLLNSDVIVTDGWIDKLVDSGLSAVGPVTNACGNEQTIPIPFVLRNGENQNINVISNFAEEREILFKGVLKETGWLGFFCFVAKKEVFLKTGLLDERFGRGGFEDDDYCIRIQENGFKMHILRDTFVYHWGTASFTQIPLPELLEHIEKNKIIFESKYNKKWESRELLLLKGFYQDINFLLEKDKSQKTLDLFNLYYKNIEMLFGSLTEVKKQNNNSKKKIKISYIKILRSIKIFPGRVIKLAKFLIKNKIIIFIVRYPSPEDLKDGYFQRVNAVDEIFSGYKRFYINTDITNSGYKIIPSVVRVKKDVFEIMVNRNNLLHYFSVFVLTLFSGRIYSHSILRLNSVLYRTLFFFTRKRVLDIHGVVPEEFLLHGDELNYKRFNKIEKFATRNSTAIIGVTQNMIDHISKKSKKTFKNSIILPILPNTERVPCVAPKKDLKNIIYCGGVQKWQQVEKMLFYVNKYKKDYNFTFLVPKPELITEEYLNLYKEKFPGMVHSAESDSVDLWYNKNAFGLVLRENIAVNNVACPTKLIEYFKNSVLPIVDTPEIGDFNKKGFKYINYKDSLPDEEKWRIMIKKNQQIYNEMCLDFEKNVKKLQEIMK